MSSASPKQEPSSSSSSLNSTTTNRNPVPNGNPKFPIFLNIPPPLKPVNGADESVTTFDANFTAIKGPNTVAAGGAGGGGGAKAPVKLNHQLFLTDCSNGCMPAYVLSSIVGVLVVGAILSIFVTVKRRKTRGYDQEATAINSLSSDFEEPRFIAEKTTTYRSSSLADIGSPNGLRRRSELGSPFAAMSELNKPFVFSKPLQQPPQRPSPAPPLVIPRSSEELYAAYTSGLVADEDTLPDNQQKKPELISPQPRSLKSITLDRDQDDFPARKKDSPVTPLEFTTLLIPDPSATPTTYDFPAATEATTVVKKHESDSDDDLVDCWSPPVALIMPTLTSVVRVPEADKDDGDDGGDDGGDDDDDDDEEDVFFMPQAFKVDEQILPHDTDLSLQLAVESASQHANQHDTAKKEQN